MQPACAHGFKLGSIGLDREELHGLACSIRQMVDEFSPDILIDSRVFHRRIGENQNRGVNPFTRICRNIRDQVAVIVGKALINLECASRQRKGKPAWLLAGNAPGNAGRARCGHYRRILERNAGNRHSVLRFRPQRVVDGFQFDHIKSGWSPKFGKWKAKLFDLPRFRRTYFDWQMALSDDGWNSLFLANHDLPRQVSKYANDGKNRVRSAKLLAIILHLMKGTLFIYQGEEIGMTNARFEHLEDFRHVELFGHYDLAIADGQIHAEFIAGANANGRDNARTPMQWSDGAHAGFSTATPWIAVNEYYPAINVAADMADPEGVTATYRKLISLRSTMPIISKGDFIPFSVTDTKVSAFAREQDGQHLSVVANFSNMDVVYDVPEGLRCIGRCLVYNLQPWDQIVNQIRLAPWEAFALSVGVMLVHCVGCERRQWLDEQPLWAGLVNPEVALARGGKPPVTSL